MILLLMGGVVFLQWLLHLYLNTRKWNKMRFKMYDLEDRIKVGEMTIIESAYFHREWGWVQMYQTRLIESDAFDSKLYDKTKKMQERTGFQQFRHHDHD